MRASGPLALGGGLLIGAAVSISNATIELALLGEATGALRWGPTLLRLLLAGQGAALILAGFMSRPSTPDANASRRTSPAPVTDHRVWIALTALTAVALALRLWRLDSGLWFDEVLTLVNFVRAPLGQILTTFPSQNQHMLFSILAHASIAAFGESVWALRLPAALFGVASVWALFLLGRRIVGTREALLACALLTVSYHHVWFSQNARGYSGLMFFTTLATWLWLEALRRGRWSWWLGYAVALALGMWMHLTMVFVPAAHVLLYAGGGLVGGWRRRDLWRPATAWLFAGSLALELHALALPQFLDSALHEVSMPSEWTNLLWAVVETWRGLALGFGKGIVVMLALLLAAAGWLSMARRHWMAAGSMVLPAFLGGATMLAASHNLWPRFFFFSTGFALLIAVHGALVAARLVARAAPHGSAGAWGDAAGYTAVGLMIAGSALSLPRCYALPKQDFVGARDYVERQRQPDDAVVAVGLAGFAYQRYFAPQWNRADTAAQLDALRRSHLRVWLVYTLPIELKADRPDVWNVIQRDFHVVQVFPGTLGGGEVNVCRARGERNEQP